jgi:hypothetical protein
MSRPFDCRNCGTKFAWSPGADLFCGDDCRADWDKCLKETEDQLVQAGFSRHAETPNLWIKDNVAISIEQAIHEGFEKAILAHQRAVTAINS